MARTAKQYPTDLELQLLKILWEEAPRTVREIRDALAERNRDLAHTSVITTLQKMVDKGQLKQLDPAEGKAYRFQPQVTEEQVSRGMLGDLLERVFGGSAEAVMLSLLDVTELDEETIKRLRRTFNDKVREQQQ